MITVNLLEVIEERLTYWSHVEADSLLAHRRAKLAQEILKDLTDVILAKVTLPSKEAESLHVPPTE